MDPLSQAIAPPADETPEQRSLREKLEEQARYRSSQIDEQIKAEKNAMKKKKKPVKILVLGQSESGKSTTIKNFQLKFARESWMEERTSWRIVIYLNLVRSVNMILELVGDEISKSLPSSDSSFSPISDSSSASIQISGPQKVLRLRLAPLQQIQRDLEGILGSPSSEPVDLSTSRASTPAAAFLDLEHTPEHRPLPEFFVRSNCGWASALNKVRQSTTHVRSHVDRNSSDTERSKAIKRADEVSEVIRSCKDDIKTLWDDPVVRDILKQHELVLEDHPGFFLNDVDRIAASDYEPSDSDVLRARLRTIGVQEYRFFLDRDVDKGREWLLYDVAGIRTSRSAWMPFFDNVDTIIFLAPISAINETLAEDRRINRIEDSLLLWRAICSSKLLANVPLIVFLNKCDILSKKLKNNRVVIKDHIADYKDRSNDVKTALAYFHKVFKNIMVNHRPDQKFVAHVTSVVDTKATAVTIVQVKEKILRDQLADAGLV